MRRISLILVLVAGLVAASAAPALARAGWKKRIDRMVGSRSMSVSVRDGGRILYRRNPSARRAPASGEKLLMSMALLDQVSPDMRFKTKVAAATVSDGVVRGDLWLLGRGDPTITGGGRYGEQLPISPTRLSRLAHKLKDKGVRKVTGRVLGSTNYFARDWWAQGWKSNFPAEEIPLPSSLTFEGNRKGDRHIGDPELRAARSLTKRLESIGVKVRGTPATGAPPNNVGTIAKVASVPLSAIMRVMNRNSSNFFAEVLGKRLAVEAIGGAGTIANGASAIEAWAHRNDVSVTAHDSSGLSYDNRISANGFTRLLDGVESESWYPKLRSTLAGADQGTLDNRLYGVKLRAKTGTLSGISTLSGWVWLRRTDSWASFSIMSSGMSKSAAVAVEDNIVRELTRNAR